MAELHVEKKRKSNTLWIVLGVVLIALIAWMASRSDDNENRTPGTTTGTTTTGSLPVTDAAILAAMTPSAQSNLIPAVKA
ncbi:MAG TPA: hypothetical protein VE861_00970 [Gemmatimonadaceae bacterium]|nr:hypothetical protein [Gemmatimonadaceae bacterium]